MALSGVVAHARINDVDVTVYCGTIARTTSGSLVELLRHLVFATDAWVLRVVGRAAGDQD